MRAMKIDMYLVSSLKQLILTINFVVRILLIKIRYFLDENDI